MTAEEIKEKVAKDKGYKDWETCINDQPNYMIEKLMDIVMEEYAQQKQYKWINVSDRLPDSDRKVLIFTDTGISLGVFDINCQYLKKAGFYDKEMWDDWWGYEEDENVTHWMELPTPPIE